MIMQEYESPGAGIGPPGLLHCSGAGFAFAIGGAHPPNILRHRATKPGAVIVVSEER